MRTKPTLYRCAAGALALAVFAVALSSCRDTDTRKGDVAPAETMTEPEETTQAAAHAGYVPGDRIDAFAVNCQLCDERWAGTRRVTREWDVVAPSHPVWIDAALSFAEAWRRMEAIHGPNSDEALVRRDEVVLLYRRARSWAESEPGNDAIAASVDLVEGLLK